MAEAGHAAGEVDNTRENKYKQILGIKTVHLLSVFALIYVGVEVTLGGQCPLTSRILPFLMVQSQDGSLHLSSREEEATLQLATSLLASSEVGCDAFGF